MQMNNINKKIIVMLAGMGLVVYMILAFIAVDIEDAGEKYSQVYRYYSFFSDLYENLGYKLEKHYKSSLPGRDAVILYFDYDDDDHESIEELTQWARDGGILFFIGIDSDNDPVTKNTIQNGPIGDIKIHPNLSKDVSKITLTKGKYMREAPEQNASEEESLSQNESEQEVYEWHPLLSISNGVILYEMDYEKGKIILLTESYLLSNWSLKNENTAILLNNILKPYYEKTMYIIQRNIFFTGNAYSYKPNSPLQVLFKQPMLFVTLQIILMGVLFAMWKGSRFGKPVHYNPYARRTLVEHLRAVGQLYSKLKSTSIIGSINNDYFIYRLKKSLGLSRNASIESVLESISKRLPMEKDELERLIYSRENLQGFQLLLNESKRERIISAIRSKSTGKI